MHSLAVPSLKRILQTACYFGNIMKFPISGKRIKKKKKKRLQTQQGSRLQFYKPVWNQLLEIDS